MNIDHQVWSPCSVPNAEPKFEGITFASDVEKQGYQKVMAKTTKNIILWPFPLYFGVNFVAGWVMVS